MYTKRNGAPAVGWSVMAAARSSRQMRIETVRHLRTAPVARELQSAKLSRAQRILAQVVGEREAAERMFRGFGFAPPYPVSWVPVAEKVITEEAKWLADADLYVLSPQMCDVVIAAAASLSPSDLELLHPDDLPTPTGVVVLPHPVLVNSAGGDVGDDRAYTWGYPQGVGKVVSRS